MRSAWEAAAGAAFVGLLVCMVWQTMINVNSIKMRQNLQRQVQALSEQVQAMENLKNVAAKQSETIKYQDFVIQRQTELIKAQSEALKELVGREGQWRDF